MMPTTSSTAPRRCPITPAPAPTATGSPGCVGERR